MAGRWASDYYKPGDWNAICSMCGRKRKASQLVRNWQGQYRCPEHNEPRHPQDFVRVPKENPSSPWSQPPVDTFVTFCLPNGVSSTIDWAVINCTIVDFVSHMFSALNNAPICNPLVFSSNYNIIDQDVEWACTSVTVSADVTISGILGVV